MLADVPNIDHRTNANVLPMLHANNYTDMHVPAFWKTKIVSYVILCAKSESVRRISLSH